MIRKNIFTSEEENKIIDLYVKGKKTIAEISQMLNVSSTPIRRVLHKNKIKISPYVPMDHEKNRLKKRTYHFNQRFFEEFSNESSAYWGGFFLTDGYINKNNWELGFRLKKDDYQHLEKFMRDINLDKALKYEEKTLGKIGKGNRKVYPQVRLNVSSIRLCKDLLKHFPWMEKEKKTYVVQYPTTVPDEFSRHLIRGILDGDGNIQNYSPTNIKVIFYGTEKLLEKISEVISLNCSVKKARVTRKEKHLFEVRWAGRKQVLRILSWLYDDAEIYLERKYQQYLGITKSDYMDLVTLSDHFTPDELRAQRISKGFSRSQLASLMGVHVSYLNNLENGYNLSTQRHHFIKLCELLEIVQTNIH